MDKVAEFETIQRTMDYNRGYVDGYKEGYSKAISEFQHIMDMQTRPIIIGIDESKGVDEESFKDFMDKNGVSTKGIFGY